MVSDVHISSANFLYFYHLIVFVSVLSHLTCASLTEDRYGVVQRDIPRILEAFLSFLSAVEDYQIEINTSYPPPSPEQLQQLSWKEFEEQEMLRIEVERASAALGVVLDGAHLIFTLRQSN
jgi:nucleoporin NDC1